MSKSPHSGAKFLEMSEELAKGKEEDPHRKLVADLEEPIIVKEDEAVVSVPVDFDDEHTDGTAIDTEKEENNTTAQTDKGREVPQQDQNPNQQPPNENKEDAIEDKSIVGKIEERIGKQLLSSVQEHSRIINEATLRAIALQQTMSADQKGDKDLIFEALDMVTKRETDKIIETFVSEVSGAINKANVKRMNISDTYIAYAQFIFTSKQIESEEMLKTEDRVISLDELRKWHLASSGFLTAPIEIYRTYIQSLLEKDKKDEVMEGKIRMGGEKYADFLDNLAIINLFKEDFFSVF